ncbi:O-methyltransferase lcsG like protein [Verticillium longisporum]|nr:O-methyltransferase lcsG like protein [Verticillium longisporum]
MSNSPETLQSLAAKVTELSASFTKFLEQNKIPQPTFEADSPTTYEGITPEAFVLRQKLLDSLQDMWYLAQGPSESIFNYVHNSMPDVAVLNILNHFNFWDAVPLDGSANHATIAKHTSLPQEVVERVLEHATTLRLFAEVTPGRPASGVRHTSRSAALAKNTGLRALVAILLDDAGPPMTLMNRALEQHCKGQTELSQDMTKTAFAVLHNNDGPLGRYKTSWDYIENDGEGEKKGWRSRNFVTFMNYLKDIFRLEQVVLDAYDWKAAGDISVVDLGGSGGHDDFALAKAYPNLKITVQDLPEVEPVFTANRPAELASRVTFHAQSFFEPQALSADVYMFKLILHDWPDKESVQILQALRPSLKRGARVLFIDYVGKQGEQEGEPLPRSIQQMGTSTDIRMMALFATKERPVKAWEEIFDKADERFEIVRVEANPMTFFVIIEAVWRG